MKSIPLYTLLLTIVIGCSGTKDLIENNTKKVLKSPLYDNQFTGLLVVNSKNRDTLLRLNSEKYFTPASNTKIVTLFAALRLLPDRIPALKYKVKNDTLYISGTGDPTLLHSHFEQNKTIEFLKEYNNIALYLSNSEDGKLGSGWAWDDYQYYFQAEKSPFPLFGNVARITNSDGLQVIPDYFKDSVIKINYDTNRALEQNKFYYAATRKDTLEVPFRTSTSLTQTLLENATGTKITITQKMAAGEKKILYSVASDSVYKRMMHQSDNFIAEQLLLVASSILSDTLNSAKTRDYILENELSGLRQQPRWVDGSGLSRYNLFTPESIVYVLAKMYETIPRERLFGFFPAGGKGTLKEWYPGDHEPYLFAKTGSVGNNHNISGYLITKSGKTLIFSFMNNHFRRSSSEVKQQMQLIFEEIRDTY